MSRGDAIEWSVVMTGTALFIAAVVFIDNANIKRWTAERDEQAAFYERMKRERCTVEFIAIGRKVREIWQCGDEPKFPGYER